MTSDKLSCRLIAGILHTYGVKNAVLCPGARDLPLITAFDGIDGVECHSIIDERVAAFFALGIAEITGNPVAVVCTSGTAVLNFAPAVAEAFYKNLPLIVISADRPMEWIDQDDSQTLRQNGILSNVVKKSYNITGEKNGDTGCWYMQREITDAAITALTSPRGPVHINVPLSMPLNGSIDDEFFSHCHDFVKIEPGETILSNETAAEAARKIQSTKKVLIVAGSGNPDAVLTKSLAKIARLPNVSVVAENLANLHLGGQIPSSQELLQSIAISANRDFIPDLLITFGGSLVSSTLKEWLRENSERIEHWHISPREHVIDTYRCLERKYVMEPSGFFRQVSARLSRRIESPDSCYSVLWHEQYEGIAKINESKRFNFHEWDESSSMRMILKHLPPEFNVQVSNGMSVRNLMECAESYKFHRVDCNRGVSGIDGSTSTALGAARAYNGKTVLFSGDMSARYDIGGMLEASSHCEDFKMVVFDNGGGGIFKRIASTDLPAIRDKYLSHIPVTDWRAIAEAMGWTVYEASGFDELKEQVAQWATFQDKPSLLLLYF